MRVWLAAIVIATACKTEPSVINVHAPPNTTLEVMLAQSCYTKDGLPCAPGINWDAKVPLLPPADVFTLDLGERRTFAVPSSGVVNVRVLPDSSNSDIDRIVLVAFDSGDNAVAIGRINDVQLTRDEQWDVQLETIADITASIADGPGGSPITTYQHVWRSGDHTKASCAVIQSWRADQFRWDREVYVPPDDLDCDGIANDVDCDPQWYKYSPQSTVSDKWCALADNVAAPNACTVGLQAPLCFDDGAATLGCQAAPEITCIPDAMCEECPLFSPGCGTAAVIDLLDTGRMPFIKCDIAYSTDSNSPGAPCSSNNNDSMTIDLGMLACNQLVVFPREWPPQPGSAFPGAFAAGTASFAASTQSSCSLDMKFDSGTAPTTVPTQLFILGIETSSGPSIDIPLVLRFHAGCTNTTGCTLKNLDYDATNPNNGDGMWSCL